MVINLRVGIPMKDTFKTARSMDMAKSRIETLAHTRESTKMTNQMDRVSMSGQTIRPMTVPGKMGCSTAMAQRLPLTRSLVIKVIGRTDFQTVTERSLTVIQALLMASGSTDNLMAKV